MLFLVPFSPSHSLIVLYRDESTQSASLGIVQKILTQLSNEELSQILPVLITSFSTHSSTQCRIVLYNILMRVYNKLWLDSVNVVYSLGGYCGEIDLCSYNNGLCNK